MRTIYFANATPIDLAAIELMGVSVKEGANPIGQFGTGLKFAIATLLRNEQRVRLWRQEPGGKAELWTFELEPMQVRDRAFSRVIMSAEGGPRKALGFTTELGKHWTLWQALRELESNVRDEQGYSTEEAVAELASSGTVFEIEGEAFAEVWQQRDKVFLPSQPLWADADLEVHPLRQDAPNTVYYRGIAAGEFQRPGLFTYNYLSTAQLTEDRTLGNCEWAVQWAAAKVLATQAGQADLERVLVVGDEGIENQFNAWPMDFSENFDKAVMTSRFNPKMNLGALREWTRRGDNEEKVYRIRPMTVEALREIVPALALAQRMGASPLGLEDFDVVDGLGLDVFGAVVRGRIKIAARTLDMGHRFLASTLYEEWLHRDQGLMDESRSMQNWLFERLAATTEALMRLEAEHGVQGEVIKVATPALPPDEIPY